MDRETEQWEGWWRLLWPRAQSYLRSVGSWNADEREDLVAEAFTRAWQKRHWYTPEKRFTTWFYTLLRRVAIDRWRRERGAKESEEWTDAEPSGPWSEPEVSWARKEDLEFVQIFLRGLSSAHRELVWWRYSEGWDLKQISRVTGRPLGTVKSDFSKIREALKGAWRAWTGEEVKK